MPKRKYWTRAQAKRARTESTVAALPPELLQHIFLNLPFDDLLTVRETCHLWWDAVGRCPALRDRFRLVLPHIKLKLVHRGYKPPPTVPASTVAFESEIFFKIGNISSWWPQVATTVTCLSFTRCEYPVTMLRHTPNLQSLELVNAVQIRAARGSSAELDFELTNLKKLLLKYSRLGHLSRVITQLKVLECHTFDRFADSMVESLQAKVQNTLEGLFLVASTTYFKEFTKLKIPGLKRVFLKSHFNGEDFGTILVPFAQRHPSIEDLTIANIFDDKVLYDVLQALPNLKRFSLELSETGISQYDELPTIPNVLPNLECLHIEWKTDYHFAQSGPKLHAQNDLRFPKLRELHLDTVTLSGDSFGNVLCHTTNLHSLTLHGCDFDNWHQLLRLITQPKALRFLKLTSFQMLDFEDEPFQCQQPIASLRYLELDDYMGTSSTDQVRELFHLFPQLTEVLFGPKADVDDALMLEMCRTLTQLERLTVHSGCTTYASTTYVRRFCRNLKSFALYNPRWKFEQDDLVYFTGKLQSFTYRGIEWKGRITDVVLSRLAQVFQTDSETESDSVSETESESGSDM